VNSELLIALGAFLFVIGVAIVITRRHAIMILLGIELMFNAANINLVVFGRSHSLLDGEIFALFVIIVAACEAAVGMAIILRIYRVYHTPVPDQVDALKETN
jgi:NADH-quinone oxidoreductase subunit K